MATITIQLDPETESRLADAVVERLLQRGVVTVNTEGNPLPSNTGTTRSDQFSQNGSISPENPVVTTDPWMAQPASSEASAPAPAEANGSVPTESPAPSVPTCNHGEMILRPAGIYQSGPKAGQPYAPFYACKQPRNAPDKCRSVPVPQ